MGLHMLFKIAHAIALIFPLNFTYWFASRVADIHFLLSKKDRVLITRNVTRVCGDAGEARRIARFVPRNFAKYLVDFLRFSKMDKRYIDRYVEFEGIDNLKRALEGGRGGVLFSGHLGNWEWGGALIARLGFPISVIALAHKDKRLNDFFINQRRMMGVKNIPLGGSVRKSAQLLSANEFIGILSDRDFSGNSVGVDFFGKTAYMPIGTAIFAVRRACPLLPVLIVRLPDGRHRLSIGSPIEYKLTGGKEADIKNVMQKVANTLEGYVREYPEQWFVFDDPWEEKA